MREIEMSAGDHGPLRSARGGPNSATIGVPTAPAMCSGPVSPDTMRLALFAIARMSVMLVAGACSAAPLDEATTADAAASSPGPHSTTDRRPRRSRIAAASAPKRAAGHRLFDHAAPGLISM